MLGNFIAGAKRLLVQYLPMRLASQKRFAPLNPRNENQSQQPTNPLVSVSPADRERLKEIFSFVDEILCLTLYGQKERQRSATAELVNFGFEDFKFIAGFDKSSPEVRAAFDDGLVDTFPNCFRCGKLECGKDDCNNTLIEPQVGTYLSFLKIFDRILNTPGHVFLVVEDDVQFLPYELNDLGRLLSRSSFEINGLLSGEPVLIRLCNLRKSVLEELHKRNPRPYLASDCPVPSNPCFIVNKPFAKLARSKFTRISHTADNFIHHTVATHAQHYTLSPPIAVHKSVLGLLPHTIHPRIKSAPLSSSARGASREAPFHFRHTKVVDLAIIGSPRCGTAFAATVFQNLGLDVRHEEVGQKGIASWMFSVKDTDLPFGKGPYAKNSRFVYPRTVGLVFRTPEKAIPSLILENTKNIQSYEFRRRWIMRQYGVDFDNFIDEETRALATFVYWYRLCLDRQPSFVLRLEHAADDIIRVCHLLALEHSMLSDEILHTRVNSGKRYLRHVFEKPMVNFEALIYRAPEILIRELEQVNNRIARLNTPKA